MNISIHADRSALGRAAADQLAESLLAMCRERGSAHLVVATGASQF
jgi:6-phosphogluconolactonase/glucosamine-6-phosphate isomerase/deaminase